MVETFIGGVVEIILFMVLLHRSSEAHSLIPVIRAAILGSILANVLLCLGFCFFVGGLRRDEQEFDEVISEVGSGLILVAGFGLLIPGALFNSLRGYTDEAPLRADVLQISRITSVVLFIAFFLWVLLPDMVQIWLTIHELRMVSIAYAPRTVQCRAQEG